MLSGGAALAGGLFGNKADDPPASDATALVTTDVVEPSAPAAPEAPPLFPEGLPVALQQTPELLA